MVKLLWLAICNIEDEGAAERAKERGQKLCRNALGRLVRRTSGHQLKEGTRITQPGLPRPQAMA